MKRMNKKGVHWMWWAIGIMAILILLSIGWAKLQAIAAPKFFP